MNVDTPKMVRGGSAPPKISSAVVSSKPQPASSTLPRDSPAASAKSALPPSGKKDVPAATSLSSNVVTSRTGVNDVNTQQPKPHNPHQNTWASRAARPPSAGGATVMPQQHHSQNNTSNPSTNTANTGKNYRLKRRKNSGHVRRDGSYTNARS